VITDTLEEAHRLLRNHPQPALETGDCHAGSGVDMHRAIDVRAPAQDAAVKRKAWTVHPGALIEIVVHVDLDEVRRRDLGPEQLVLLHQEFALLARDAH
jgi:hypothetical protein